MNNTPFERLVSAMEFLSRYFSQFRATPSGASPDAVADLAALLVLEVERAAAGDAGVARDAFLVLPSTVEFYRSYAQSLTIPSVRLVAQRAVERAMQLRVRLYLEPESLKRAAGRLQPLGWDKEETKEQPTP